MDQEQKILSSLGENLSIAVIGSNGGLGSAFVKYLLLDPSIETIACFSRTKTQAKHPKLLHYQIDITNEQSIECAAKSIGEKQFDLIIVATGVLHNKQINPEKSFRDLKLDIMNQVFLTNTLGPALVAKHFIPKLKANKKTVLAFLSARVGSISDNRLGGWYAYRASKAALNMIIKNLAIEAGRNKPKTCIIGLHPGTVDTPLSKPYQKNVQANRLFTPEFSTEHLINIINNISAIHSGKIFAWDGKEVPA